MPRKAAKTNGNDEILKGIKNIALFIHLAPGVTAKLLQDGVIPGRFLCNSWRVWRQDLIDFIRTGNQINQASQNEVSKG